MRLALAILLCAASVARADTVTGMVQSVGFATTPAQRIIFEPLGTPLNISGVFTHSASNQVFANTNGWFSNRLAGPAYYRVRVGAHPRDVMTNFVIGDGGTYDWLSLATNATIANTQTIAFVIRSQGVGVSNQFTRPRIFSYPGGTNAGGDSNKVWTLTNTVTGEGEWRSVVNSTPTGGTNYALNNFTNYGHITWATNAVFEGWGGGSYGAFVVTNFISFSTNGNRQWLEITNDIAYIAGVTNVTTGDAHRDVELWIKPVHFYIATNRQVILNSSWGRLSGAVTNTVLSNKCAVLRLRITGSGGEGDVFAIWTPVL